MSPLELPPRRIPGGDRHEVEALEPLEDGRQPLRALRMPGARKVAKEDRVGHEPGAHGRIMRDGLAARESPATMPVLEGSEEND